MTAIIVNFLGLHFHFAPDHGDWHVETDCIYVLCATAEMMNSDPSVSCIVSLHSCVVALNVCFTLQLH